MITAALVPAAGRGRRFGSAENKIWAQIGGRPILRWSVSALNDHEAIDSVIVIAESAEVERARETLDGLSKVKKIVVGGDTRAESVLNGLRTCADSEYVIVHDAARPLVSHEVISRVIEETHRAGAAVPGIPVGDTLKRADSDRRITETVSRAGLWSAQTPQGASRGLLLSAYEKLGTAAYELTDEAGILEAAGIEVRLVPGDPDNIKITMPDDLRRAEALLAGRNKAGSRETRTGFGYDVHAFAENRELWLGGVRIPYPMGLAGHSDADVVLHAVCDALLGAAGMGDIGRLFPDTNSAHKDRPSIEFLREVGERIRGAGWRIANVDVTLLAEEPRVSPYRDRMSAVIAPGLQTAPKQINIKATTSEGLGFVGRREGMACWAVATLLSTI